MREHLATLDEAGAFQTSRRFDLLASDHVPHITLGTVPDSDALLKRSIERAEGLITVVGRSGSGKSSMIAAVTDGLSEEFVPLRVSVVGVEAGDPAAFARHAILELSSLDPRRLTEREQRVLARTTAVRRTDERRREVRGGAKLRAGEVLSIELAGDITASATALLEHQPDPADLLTGLQRLFDLFWTVGRCPVLLVEDTDHWGNSLELADRFFDQTARGLMNHDAVMVVAAQAEYTALAGYVGIRDALNAEVALQAPRHTERALEVIFARRFERSKLLGDIGDVFEPDALQLLAGAYEQTVASGAAGDLRRTLAIARTALEIAVQDSTIERIGPGHVQEAMASMPVTPW